MFISKYFTQIFFPSLLTFLLLVNALIEFKIHIQLHIWHMLSTLNG